jgi:hypothetical protein
MNAGQRHGLIPYPARGMAAVFLPGDAGKVEVRAR